MSASPELEKRFLKSGAAESLTPEAKAALNGYLHGSLRKDVAARSCRPRTWRGQHDGAHWSASRHARANDRRRCGTSRNASERSKGRRSSGPKRGRCRISRRAAGSESYIHRSKGYGDSATRRLAWSVADRDSQEHGDGRRLEYSQGNVTEEERRYGQFAITHSGPWRPRNAGRPAGRNRAHERTDAEADRRHQRADATGAKPEAWPLGADGLGAPLR